MHHLQVEELEPRQLLSGTCFSPEPPSPHVSAADRSAAPVAERPPRADAGRRHAAADTGTTAPAPTPPADGGSGTITVAAATRSATPGSPGIPALDGSRAANATVAAIMPATPAERPSSLPQNPPPGPEMLASAV